MTENNEEDLLIRQDVEDYRRVIRAITDPTIDYREIVIRLAEEYPAVLMEVVEPSPFNKVLAVWTESGGNKVKTIKFVRAECGIGGLKEAKDYVEDLIDKGALPPINTQENNW